MLRVAKGEEENDGQPTCHLRRVAQGGHGVGDASATTFGQSSARGRLAKSLSVLVVTEVQRHLLVVTDVHYRMLVVAEVRHRMLVVADVQHRLLVIAEMQRRVP